ncbi:hypothetical protein BD779DRAFT_1530574 [Infundibulicybe gibba]|nr:hypothetical protein BD779DRAFT_1530574 [Infundibulicybe gibba]
MAFQQLDNVQPVPSTALCPPLRRRTSSSPTSVNPLASGSIKRKPAPPVSPPTLVFPSSPERITSFGSPNNHPASIRTPPSRSHESTHVLDMKRLLAKPAPLSGSESEGRKSIDRTAFVDSRRSLGSRNYGSGGLGRGRKRIAGANAGAEPIEKERIGEKDDKERVKEKRPRNVLRRRPSGSRSQGSPPTPINPTTSHKTRSRSRSRSRPPSPGRVPAYPRDFDLSLEDKQKSPAPHSQNSSPHSSLSGNRTRALTPAGAVVEAYKRQDSKPNASGDRGDTRATGSQTSHKSYDKEWEEQEQEPSTPYYTVFGSTSGRVVAVGGPEDSWDRYQHSYSRVLSPGKSPKARTLTRKVSARWKRGGEPRPSLQERRDRGSKRSIGEGDRKSLRLSLEKRPDHDEIPWSRKSEPVSGSAGGSKMWKLMKRISTGGLRDNSNGHGVLSRLISRSTSASVSAPSTASMHGPGHSPSRGPMKTPPASAPPPPPPIPPASSNTGHRPSTTTRSSSPVSSDVASSRFFNRTQKASSASGRKSRPGTSGSRSLPPEETKKSRGPPLQTRSFTSHIKAEDWSIVRTPQEELPSLPVPPRRLHHSAAVRASLEESHHIRSASPAIPAFSTSDAINTFGPASTHRPSPTTSASTSRVTSPARRDDRIPEVKFTPNRKSSGAYSNASTARPRRGSGSSLPPPPNAATALTFREIGSPADKHALTEKEKADKWDDLLERSARAGGTLHLGAGAPEHGLQSDMLRFSNYSEISSDQS